MIVDSEPVGRADPEAFDCFLEMPNFTIVTKKFFEELARKLFE